MKRLLIGALVVGGAALAVKLLVALAVLVGTVVGLLFAFAQL